MGHVYVLDRRQYGAGIILVSAWRSARRPVELHVYQAGGHGFGLGIPGTTTTGMIGQFLDWLDARGLLKPEAKK